MDILERAIKELNEEGFLQGNKITENGKLEVEGVIKQDKEFQTRIFIYFWKKLESLFYESDAINYSIKLLELEKIFKKLNINFQDCLEFIIKNE